MATLTIRLDDDLDAALSRIAVSAHRTKSDLVRAMIRKQTALETFQHVRAELVPLAEHAGYLTDEDVFRDIS